MSFIVPLLNNVEPHVSSLIYCFSTITSEVFNFTAFRQLSQMFTAIFLFHGSEYLLALFFHGKNSVTLESLLISKNYVLAMVGSLVEYLIEIYFFPGMKEHWLISNTGLALVVVGELMRKLAIITAGRSFTHSIRRSREQDHVLITHGVYKYIRHPSYCGFLIWSVGTQIMLCNPVCTLGFAAVVWRFFHQRIQYEEHFLRQIFGSRYVEYARQTTSGIPFVK
ncbi:protein-S-isoprenylcysteine O-methyltransferase B-like isoform X1 [Salvia splendens]|uniref:protein-S-isoprenylcysteine O-methyltransferase B-like isoform X1 n=1 Tax=Salvia splendens TaxID=180675 RepID=UPI001C27BCE6|nr:protein-S-isoprenylcysteine O-methyltransferase B-like isoform X1 [Salvia splendens]